MKLLKSYPISFDQVFMMVMTLAALAVFCHFAGLPLIIPFLVFLFGLHLFFYKKAPVRVFLHLGFLLVLLLFAAHLLKSSTGLSYFYLPVAVVAMLTTLLFNDMQLTFMMAFMSSALAGLMMDFSLSETLILFMGSLAGAYKLKDARTRGVVLWAGLLAAFVQVSCYYLINPDINTTVAMGILKPLFINGLISGIVVIASLKVFEALFGEVTNFTLLELSDSSHPLLKRMVVEAPGTYHHSLIVSNLAEAAADAIGAHALLVRVGAYYHDIGKMVNPEYFTENQIITGNKHDLLEPSMSRLVILNHVKEGVDLARKYRLSQKIVDFIPQHHGTSLIHYFYQKALAEGEAQEVGEEEYRYPGPKPQTKESAIVLLADSVEGATRALEEHTPQKIEDLARKVINNKFIDGQLDECNLTLRDIDAIASTFVRVLGAMYHSRVKYPETSK
ncbi:MAG: HDIG domain-containing protein [Candidatus Omnitrophica bacterium]|nr:HDIG domain-containing protein [Candidatus Omnitrophota bacterium]